MRLSSIQLMRISRRGSLNTSASLNHHDSTLEGVPKTQLGQKLIFTKLKRVATQKNLDKKDTVKVIDRAKNGISTEPCIKEEGRVNIPEYEFLKSKEEIESNPFLRAKMKYLVTKERPLLVRQISKGKGFFQLKGRGQTGENVCGSFTTLREESQRENKKKLNLLTGANSVANLRQK